MHKLSSNMAEGELHELHLSGRFPTAREGFPWLMGSTSALEAEVRTSTEGSLVDS